MLNLKVIAITGGVASGKSTVCRLLEELGAFVVSADALIHEILLKTDTPTGQKIQEILGSDVVQECGGFDHQKIANKIFKSPEQRKQLEQLLHPLVYKEIKTIYETLEKPEQHLFFVVELPLLFESSSPFPCDKTVAVVADEPLAKKRFAKKGFSLSEYDQRMQTHLSPLEKAKRADYTIENNGSLEDLKNQVLVLKDTLIQ